jgi:hypothetical protein
VPDCTRAVGDWCQFVEGQPFPSNPHAHNLESRLRLHLGTGELFDKRRVVEKISRKDLLDIRKRLKNFDLPELDF